MRVMDRKGRIFGTMTPLSGLTWVYDEIYLNAAGDDEVWCLFMEWADNPWLDGEEIKLLTEYMPEDELESRRYGRFVSESGPVYLSSTRRCTLSTPSTCRKSGRTRFHRPRTQQSVKLSLVRDRRRRSGLCGCRALRGEKGPSPGTPKG